MNPNHQVSRFTKKEKCLINKKNRQIKAYVCIFIIIITIIIMYNYIMCARGKLTHDKRKDSNIIKNIEKGTRSCIILIL